MAEEEKKKSNKGKIAFMFAFAVTVLGSRAGALSASAAVAPSDDANADENAVTNNAQNEIGSNESYLKCGENVYIASQDAKAVVDFNNTLSGLKGFAAYTKYLNMYGIHVEGNICAETVNKFDVFNTNVADNFVKNGVEAPSVYTCYISEVPQDGGDTIKLGIYDGTSYELVFGFDFEQVSLDHGHGIGFMAGGKLYTIDCQGKADKVTLRRADNNDDLAKINENLAEIAQAGEKLINEVGYSAAESANSLRDAAFAIQCGYVQPGQTLVACVNANDLRANADYIRTLLTANGGVKVIINVITDENTTYVDMGVVNDGVNWNLSNANVTFNFGAYAYDIKTSQMGGIIIAPNAHFFNDGVLSGSVFASDVRMNNEIHQIAADDGNVPEDENVPAETPSDKNNTDEDTDEDVLKDTEEEPEETPETDDTTGGDDPEDNDDTDDIDDPDDPEDKEDVVEGEDPTIETDDDPEEESTPDEPENSGDNDNSISDEVIDDTPTDEPTEETPAEEPVEDTPTDEPTEDIPTEEPVEETPTEEPTEETPTEDPVEDTPTDEPTEETPAEEPVEDTPTYEPTEETPAEEPVEDTPTDEPTEETPTEKPVEDTPTEEPTEETPAEDPVEDTPADETAEENIPEVEAPEEPEMPDDDFDNDEVDEDEQDIPEEEPEDEETAVESSEAENNKIPDNDNTIIIDNIELDDFEDDTEISTPENSNQNNISNIEIPDEDVPLGDNPYTGVEDSSAGLAIGAAFALGATVAASVKRKDKKS